MLKLSKIIFEIRPDFHNIIIDFIFNNKLALIKTMFRYLKNIFYQKEFNFYNYDNISKSITFLLNPHQKKPPPLLFYLL